MPLFPKISEMPFIGCDAVVNVTSNNFVPCTALDKIIHKAGGRLLEKKFREEIAFCADGKAFALPAYGFDEKYIIYTAGPKPDSYTSKDMELLRECYSSAFEVARRNNCRSLAVPLHFNAKYGRETVMRSVYNILNELLNGEDMDVYLTVAGGYGPISGETAGEVREYIFSQLFGFSPFDELLYGEESAINQCADLGIDFNGLDDECADFGGFADNSPDFGYDHSDDDGADFDDFSGGSTDFDSEYTVHRADFCAAPPSPRARRTEKAPAAESYPHSIDRQLISKLGAKEKSFSESLLELIDSRGMTDVECYTRANIDRRHFSKIRSNPDYTPKKPTVLAFAVALRLSLEETKTLLEKAGLALSHSNEQDIVVEYFIERRKFDVAEINYVLCDLGLPLLGINN